LNKVVLLEGKAKDKYGRLLCEMYLIEYNDKSFQKKELVNGTMLKYGHGI